MLSYRKDKRASKPSSTSSPVFDCLGILGAWSSCYFCYLCSFSGKRPPWASSICPTQGLLEVSCKIQTLVSHLLPRAGRLPKPDDWETRHAWLLPTRDQFPSFNSSSFAQMMPPNVDRLCLLVDQGDQPIFETGCLRVRVCSRGHSSICDPGSPIPGLKIRS